MSEVNKEEMKEFLNVCEGSCDHPYCWSQKRPTPAIEVSGGFEEWFHENYNKVHAKYKSQRYFNEAFIFSRAAWNAAKGETR